MNTPRTFTSFSNNRQTGLARTSLVGGIVATALASAVMLSSTETTAEQKKPAFGGPTNSSPIALSADKKLIWVVSPTTNTVSVIRTDLNTKIAEIGVGDEPQSIALAPDNTHAYVANTADGTVTLITIKNPDPASFAAQIDDVFGGGKVLTTGAEPYNLVFSPDGRRVFVSNSGQDTITVIDTNDEKIIGHVDLRDSVCNDPDRNRRFQPRGLAVTQDNSRLYVTRFLSFTKEGGKQADDNGREGLVCRLDINTHSPNIGAYVPVSVVRLASQVTGFQVDNNGDGVADDTSAFPNQLQSIVIRGDQAYLPNIAASPQGPQIFNVTTQAFVNRIAGVTGASQADAGALNLNLGARNPEAGKVKLFFANQWAIAFTSQSGAGNAYTVSAGSDLLVKLNVAAGGELSNTMDADTTRYIDLNDPDNPATQGTNAGKNPLGLVINDASQLAYVMNNVSRNVSVVDLKIDAVVKTIKTGDLPPPGSVAERVAVGAEMFFSSRGNFDAIPGATISLRNRLANEAWQSCASCHFEGLTDSIVWAFGTGARKSVPLNGSFNPHNPSEQRILNYSAIFDEIEDFEGNIRDTSGPGQLANPVPCDDGTAISRFDPNHGLLIGAGNVNNPPCVIDRFNPPNGFVPPNVNQPRPQVTVTLPGSNVKVPALNALKEWVQFAIRTPSAPFNQFKVAGGTPIADIIAGRIFFQLGGCASCHGGQQWTSSIKDFVSPPDPAGLFTEREPPFTPNPVGVQYIDRFLRDIKSFNLNVPGSGNAIPGQSLIGGVEKTAAAGAVVAAQDGLGRDYSLEGSRSFGKGIGFSPPSLLAIGILPPYYHNGACETLACVLSDANHRKAGNSVIGDILADPFLQRSVVRFLESIDAETTAIE